jgi:hypothetical protein
MRYWAIAGGDLKVSNSEENQIILEANDVLRVLDIADEEVKIIRWRRTRRIQVLGSELVLPSRLKEKLSAGDWRPLITSSMLYHRFLGRWRASIVDGRATSPIMSELVLPLAISTLALATAEIVVLRTQGTFTIFWWAAFAAWCVFEIFILRRAFILKPRSFQLMADKEAAELVGGEALVSVLNRLQELQESDIQPNMAERLRILPNIETRIKNLTTPLAKSE